MLQCDLDFTAEASLEELQWLSLYRGRIDDSDADLTFAFGDVDGIWKDRVAVGAAYHALSGLPDFDAYQESFDIIFEDQAMFFVRRLPRNSDQDLFEFTADAFDQVRSIVALVNQHLFGFKWKTAYEKDEPLFTKEVVIPVLRRMGFQSVRYNHGVTEYGRDVLFSEVDKFSRVRHYAAQVKAGSIDASNGTLLNQLIAQIDDAFAMPIKGAGKARLLHIAEVFVICSGRISEGAVERLNQKLDPRLAGSLHFLDGEDVKHLAEAYLYTR